MDVLERLRGRSALRRCAVVSLIMNMVIVATGGLVRFTGSGPPPDLAEMHRRDPRRRSRARVGARAIELATDCPPSC